MDERCSIEAAMTTSQLMLEPIFPGYRETIVEVESSTGLKAAGQASSFDQHEGGVNLTQQAPCAALRAAVGSWF